MKLKLALAAASMLAALGSPTAAHALGVPTIYDNYQMVPIGSRAAGMGGAYTALSCDEAALHYNVASLSCSGSSHLELSANAYVIQGALARGSLGTGEDISAMTYHSIPSIVGAVRVIKKGEDRTRVATYPKRLTFGFSVSLPTSLAADMGEEIALAEQRLGDSTAHRALLALALVVLGVLLVCLNL